ncbi:MAG: clostripain-related cysteine peptidase, partial [Synergistaceae bacterium]|nr:clostripain-related cysteine peptidase [Synergistaceae bacterium]
MNVRKCMRAMAPMLLVFLSCFLIFSTDGAASTVSGDVQTLPEQQPAARDPWDWGDPVPDGRREWTIIAFLDGDNNLEQFVLQDMKEMETGFPGPGTDVIVLLDRSKEYSTAMGNWTGTRAYRLKKYMGEGNIDSELIHDFGELNLGDEAVLEAFLRAALRKFPAPKNALFMWDHGSGWINMANDDDAPGSERKTDEITLEEFTNALRNSASLLPEGKLDLIFFDMCLMGQAETVTACAPFARYMVAAAPTIPGVGMDYTKALTLFAGNRPTADIAAELVRTGVRGFGENGRKDGAYTAFDLSKTDEFLAAFSAFSQKLTGRIPEEWANITRTIFYAQNYGGRGDYLREKSSLSSIDLRDWLARLRKIMKSPPSLEIAELEKAVASLIIATEKGPMLVFSQGMSIYIPLRENNLRNEYSGLDFNRKTGWVSTLSALYRKQRDEGMVPPRVVSIEFGTPKVRQGVTRPVGGSDYDLVPLTQVIPLSANLPRSSYVKLIFEGNAILWGYAGFAYADVPQGEYTIVSDAVLLDEGLDPEGSQKKWEEAADISDAMTPVFRDGRNELLYQVGALIHLLSNGQQSVPVTARFRDVSDLFHFTIDGTYSDPQTRGEIPVELIVDTQTYSIVAMTSIVATENGMAISDISPRPEGIFRPSLLKFGTDGNMRVVSGEGIRWSEGLDVIMEMIPAGKTLRILGQAESIGGAGAAMVSPPVTIAENPEITPRLEETRRTGAGRLPGRYATFGAVAQRNGQGPILAPAGNVLEIGQPGKMGKNAFPVRSQLGDQQAVEFVLLWEPRGLPILTAYGKDEKSGEYVPSERRFAVVQTEGQSYFWTTFDAYTMRKTIMMPLDEMNFPAAFMLGTWKGNDGSSLELGRGSAVYISEKGARMQGNPSVRDN